MDLIGGSTTSFNLTADAVTNLTLLLFYSLPNILNVSSTRESSTVYLDTRRNNNSDYKHDSPHYHSHSHLNGESPFFPPISSFLSSSSNWLLHEPIDSSSSQPPIMQSSSSSESDSYNDHSLTLDSERPFLQSTSFPLDSPFKLNNGDYSSSLESFPSFSLTIPLVNMSSDSNSNEDESQSSFRQPNNESKIFNQFDDQFSGLTDLTIGLTSSNVTENQVSSDWWSSSLSPSVIFKSNETIFTFNASQDNDGEPSFPVDNNSIGLTPFNASNHVNQLIIEYNWFYLMLGLLVFVGCFGNILVCLAICLERRLQNATNFFLLSLAIADLLVSILVMPMSIVNEVYGYWPFGTLTCNFWVTCDVLCCSSSIYHMCFISVGRYVGIKNPLHARQARLLVSRRAVLFKIVLVWLIAALITSPITILGIADSSNIMPESAVCSISNKYFLIIGAFSAFYLPMIIMVNSYVLTVRLLRRKAKFCKNSGEHGKWPPSARSSINRKSHENQGDNGKYSGSSGNQNYCKKDFDTGKCKNTFTSKTRSLHSISDGADDFQRKTNHNHLGGKRLSSTGSLLRGHFGTEIRGRISKHYNTQPMMIRTLGSSVQVRTEQKATQVLGLVFFLFIICWSPFFTRNLIEAVFTDIQMPNSLPTIFLWLGYFSSTINPVIYTIFNRNFRRAFRRILLCQTIKYRLQRSSQSFNPNQRFGGRRGIYRYSNQNSPNNNNNSKHNDNNRSNSLNNSNNNVSNNSNRNVNSNNVLHNKLGSNNSENGRFYEDNVDLNNINLNMESNTDNVIDDDNNYHIHGYIYSKSGRLMDNMKSMKSIGSNGVEYSDDDEDGGDLDEDNDNDYLGSNEDDSTTFGSKICCTIKNKQLSDQVNAKYNSRSDECDNYRDKALNMRYYWKYSKADLKAKSEPVATIKCCSEV